jgi:hypothetical protein
MSASDTDGSQPLLADYTHSNGRASENPAPPNANSEEENEVDGHPNHPFFSKRHYNYHRDVIQRFLASKTQQ